jgi:molecular chaperone Hsp33
MSKIVRTISADASVVATAIDATEIVSRIEQIHKTSAVVTAALGRLSIAASLIGNGLKGDDESVTLRLNGDGQTGVLIAVADSNGNVKSYVSNPVVEIPLNQYGKLDVAGAVGKKRNTIGCQGFGTERALHRPGSYCIR